MSGRLRLFIEKQNRLKHDHFILKTNKEHLLVFNDPRRFGFIDYDKSDQFIKKVISLNLGIDALDTKLMENIYYQKLVKNGTN